MKFRGLWQITVSLVLAFGLQMWAQNASKVSAETKANAKAQASKEFTARKNELMQTKKVTKWPGKGLAGHPGGVVVALTVSECTWLGGTVVYWSSCGDTLMKCVGASGRELCIDTVK